MPDSCCAVGCTNRRRKGDKSLSFYRIPSSSDNEEKAKRRTLWITAIKRKNWSDELIDNARICSAHFISGNYQCYDILPPSIMLSTLWSYRWLVAR